MPTTPTWGLPYPAATDPADVPADMGELALAVEADLTGLDGRLDVVEAVGPFTRHYCQIYRAAALATPDNAATWTPVPWTAADSDFFNMHTDGSAVVTTPAAGLWLLSVYAAFAAPIAAGRYGLRFSTAGTPFGAAKWATGGGGGGNYPAQAQAIIALGAATPLQVEINQNGQGAGWGLDATAARLTAVRIA